MHCPEKIDLLKRYGSATRHYRWAFSELHAKRGILRWVQRYLPEFENRWRAAGLLLNARRIAQVAAENFTCSSGSFASFHDFLLTACWTPGSIESGSVRTSRMNGFHASESRARRLAALTWAYPGRMSDRVIVFYALFDATGDVNSRAEARVCGDEAQHQRAQLRRNEWLGQKTPSCVECKHSFGEPGHQQHLEIRAFESH